MKNEHWIVNDGSTDPKFFDELPATVRARTGQDVKGCLHLDGVNDSGQMRIFVSYNSSPFQDTVRNETFYLTQEQLIEFQTKGERCVLIPPRQNPN